MTICIHYWLFSKLRSVNYIHILILHPHFLSGMNKEHAILIDLDYREQKDYSLRQIVHLGPHICKPSGCLFCSVCGFRQSLFAWVTKRNMTVLFCGNIKDECRSVTPSLHQSPYTTRVQFLLYFANERDRNATELLKLLPQDTIPNFVQHNSERVAFSSGWDTMTCNLFLQFHRLLMIPLVTGIEKHTLWWCFCLLVVHSSANIH